MAGKTPNPLFQEWFGLNINLDSHFVYLKKVVFCFRFFFFVVKASRLRGVEMFFFGFRVSAIFFLKIFP